MLVPRLISISWQYIISNIQILSLWCDVMWRDGKGRDGTERDGTGREGKRQDGKGQEGTGRDVTYNNNKSSVKNKSSCDWLIILSVILCSQLLRKSMSG